MTTLKYKRIGEKTSCFTVVRHSIEETLVSMLELLEIEDAPPDKVKFVVYWENDIDTLFFECRSLEEGQTLFTTITQKMIENGDFDESAYPWLYKAVVDCYDFRTREDLVPWFFAPSPQCIEGDFVRLSKIPPFSQN